MTTAKSSDSEDLSPLEPIMTKHEAVKRTQGAQRGLMTRENEKKDGQTMDVSSTNLTNHSDDDESTKAQPKSRKARVDYNTVMDRWKHRDMSTVFFQLHLRGIEIHQINKQSMTV